jgi:hypothetical protein
MLHRELIAVGLAHTKKTNRPAAISRMQIGGSTGEARQKEVQGEKMAGQEGFISAAAKTLTSP